MECAWHASWKIGRLEFGKSMMPAARVVLAYLLCAPGVPAQQTAALIPLTALPLRLVGVMKDASAPDRSAGLIQCGGPQEKRSASFVAVGDRACDVAEVREIREEGVVIRNLLTSRLEWLALPRVGSPSAPPAPAAIEAPVEPERDEIAAPYVQASSADVVTIEISRELLHRYMSNLPEVLNAALATPHRATGSSGSAAVDGFELSRVKPGGIVEHLGLRDGDILLEYNGHKLDSLTAVTALFGQAQALSGAKMTVLRSGRKMTFVFSVR